MLGSNFAQSLSAAFFIFLLYLCTFGWSLMIFIWSWFMESTLYIDVCHLIFDDIQKFSDPTLKGGLHSPKDGDDQVTKQNILNRMMSPALIQTFLRNFPRMWHNLTFPETPRSSAYSLPLPNIWVTCRHTIFFLKIQPTGSKIIQNCPKILHLITLFQTYGVLPSPSTSYQVWTGKIAPLVSKNQLHFRSNMCKN